MKANRIIVALLVLIGFGSCANRPSKSKAPENEPGETIEADSLGAVDVIPDMRMMYGVPRRNFDPEQAQPLRNPSVENSVTEETPEEE